MGYRTTGLSDQWAVGLSDQWAFGTAGCPPHGLGVVLPASRVMEIFHITLLNGVVCGFHFRATCNCGVPQSVRMAVCPEGDDGLNLILAETVSRRRPVTEPGSQSQPVPPDRSASGDSQRFRSAPAHLATSRSGRVVADEVQDVPDWGPETVSDGEYEDEGIETDASLNDVRRQPIPARAWPAAEIPATAASDNIPFRVENRETQNISPYAREASGKILHSIIRKPGVQLWEFLQALQSMVAKFPGDPPVTSVLDGLGHNLLVSLVIQGRSELLLPMYWLGLWGQLCSRKVSPAAGSSYPGLLAKDVADKLLHKTSGPQTYDTFCYYDSLDKEMTSVRLACIHGNTRELRKLIQQEPGVLSSKDASGFGLLAYGVAGGNREIMAILLQYGVDKSTKNDKGQTILHLAAILGHSTIISFLLEKCFMPKKDLPIADNAGFRYIDYISMNGDLRSLEVIVNAGVSVDGRCVALAAKCGRLQMVRHLMENLGVPLTGTDDNGRTPLLNAVYGGHLSIVTYLLSNGACVKDVDNRKRNCFHLVADQDCKDIFPVVYAEATRQGCKEELLNARDLHGGHECMLLVRGQDSGRPAWHYVDVDRRRVTAFQAQIAEGRIDVKNFGRIMLSGFGRYPNASKKQQMLDILGDRLRDPGCPEDMTPLHVATFRNNSPTVRLFLESGANPNIQDSFGLTPLHLAAMRGNSAVAKLIEGHGGRHATQDCGGRTASAVAIDNGNVDLASYLDSQECVAVVEVGVSLHGARYIQRPSVVRAWTFNNNHLPFIIVSR